MAKVIITGATGMLGSQLVAHYLSHTSHDLILLMRSKKNATKEQRLAEIFDFWSLPKNNLNRISISDVEITKPLLGIDQTLIQQNQTSEIYFVHALSPLRHDLTREVARQDILVTTQEALKLAKKFKNLKRFAYISTMEVFGSSQGTFYEKFIDTEPHFFNNYEYGKYHAELFLKDEISMGAPITIFRPSMIVGHSSTGKISKFFSFYLALEKFIIKPDYPIMPPAPAIITVAVDWAARAIQLLSEADFAKGEIYHLTQGQDDTIDLKELRALTEKFCIDLNMSLAPAPTTAPNFVFKIALGALAVFALGKTRRQIKNQLLFLDFCGFIPVVDNSKLQAHLKKLNVTWPKFSDYAEPIIKYYLAERGKKNLPF